SVVARLRPATRNIPSYVWLQNMEYDAGPRYQTGGSLGQAFAPLRVGTYLDNPSAPDFRFKAFDPPAGVSTEQLLGRPQLLADLDPSATPQGRPLAGTTAARPPDAG